MRVALVLLLGLAVAGLAFARSDTEFSLDDGLEDDHQDVERVLSEDDGLLNVGTADLDINLSEEEQKSLYGYIRVKKGENYLNKMHRIHPLDKRSEDARRAADRDRASKKAAERKARAAKKAAERKARAAKKQAEAEARRLKAKAKAAERAAKERERRAAKKLREQARKAEREAKRKAAAAVAAAKRKAAEAKRKAAEAKRKAAAAAAKKAFDWAAWHKKLAARVAAKKRAEARRLARLRRKQRAALKKARLAALRQRKALARRARRVRGCHPRDRRCRKSRSALKKWRARRRKLQRIYQRMYRRYLRQMAMYFRRKYRILVVEYLKSNKQNKGMRRALQSLVARLSTNARLRRLQKQHRRLKQALRKQRGHSKHLRRRLNGMRATIKALRRKMVALRAKLLGLQGRSRRQHHQSKAQLAAERRKSAAERARHAKMSTAQRAKQDRLNNQHRALLNRLKAAHKKLTTNMRAAHQRTKTQLSASQTKIKQLQAQLAGVKRAMAAAQASLGACKGKYNIATRNAAAASAQAQGKYNALNAVYKAALAKHGNIAGALQAQNKNLQKQIAELKNRCIPDVCGVCNGNESSCAKKRSASTCHAVGDPHYRSFDGYTFNYQVTGEFILAKHLNEFEVQNRQRRCPNPMPRCNSGIAVKGGNHIVIVYADWSTSTILVDGSRVRTTRGRRVAISKDLSYTAHATMVDVRYKDARVRVYIRPWSTTHYIDTYVTAPWRWSSGRSMQGLCGDFDNNRNDRSIFARARGYWVHGTARSLFRNPKPKALAMEDMDEARDDDDEGEIGGNAADAQAEDDGLPHHHEKLVFKTAAQKKLIEEKCSTAHGTDRRDCEWDIINGQPGDERAHTAHTAQLLDHEKYLAKCAKITKPQSRAFNSNRLPEPEHHEGISVAFWFKPEDVESDEKRSVLSKGTALQVTTQSKQMLVAAGGRDCTVATQLAAGVWHSYVVSISRKGGFSVYVDGNTVKGCTVDEAVTVEENDFPLELGDKGMTPQKGDIAHLYYAPLTVTSDEVKRYANRRVPLACEKDADIARPQEDDEEEDDDEDDEE
eukprot:CAMPEP_0114552598 /NCGR_PEP_ID=MMETSP0114-20121206/7208_1 /TAXON_ID=31324 /ORGANISM="Goniomonas sp, Strain m" /LENGTH=1058 /DNA_ID=CAMNT_0001737481 /DNA_START=8 /DNA_END=3184 /DNA_ORIENTATION=-